MACSAPTNRRAAIVARVGGNALNLTQERDFASGPTHGRVEATERQWADLIGIYNVGADLVGSPLGRGNPGEDGKRAQPATSNNRAKVDASGRVLAWTGEVSAPR